MSRLQRLIRRLLLVLRLPRELLLRAQFRRTPRLGCRFSALGLSILDTQALQPLRGRKRPLEPRLFYDEYGYHGAPGWRYSNHSNKRKENSQNRYNASDFY